MHTRRSVTLVVIAFVVFSAIVVTVGVTGYRVTNVAAALSRIVSYTSVIQKDVKAADLSAVSKDLIELDDLTQEMLVSVSDPILSATLDGLPVVGRNLDAARSVAAAAAGVTFAARPLATILPALDPAVLVKDGKYNTATFSKLDDAIKGLSSQLTVSSKQIAGISHDGLNSRFVELIDKIGPALDSANTLITQLEPLVAILPIMLDSRESHTWFVALQNLTEARGTGGLIGSYAVLDTSNGSIKLTASGSDQDLQSTPVPLDGLPEDFVDLQGENVVDWLSLNVSPNFPYSGQMIDNSWKAVSGQSVDGVVAFGQGIVQYLLAATGPIAIDGTTVDSTNVVEFLSLGVYAKYPNAADKNEFVAKLVAKLFKRLQAGEFDLDSLLSSTAGTPTSDRVQAWSPHEDTQAQIVAAGIDGTIPDSYGPTALVAINNGGGNKLEQFLDVKVDYALGACTADSSEHSRASTLTVTLTNDAPTSGLPAYVTPRSDYASTVETKPVGSNLEIVDVYLPVAAEEGDSTVDGQDEFGYIGVVAKRVQLEFAVELNPGQSKTLVVPWTEPTVGPDVVDMLGAQASVITQPSLNPIEITTPTAKTCS